MEQDLFQLLPSEIIIDILSRLPIRAIVTSKCVSKPWLDLLSSDAFVSSHLSKSVPALAVMTEDEEESIWCKVFEFVDGDDDVVVVERRSDLFRKFEFGDGDDDNAAERRYNQLTKFKFKDGAHHIVGAVDGLLALRSLTEPCNVLISNPFTREIVELPRPCCYSSWGFGASKITGHHKVVHICCNPESECGLNMCQVYTLETGSWRCFDVAAEFRYFKRRPGVFVNGNLHWLGSDSIVCFDLETECLSMFSAPPHLETAEVTSISVFEDYLCVCASMPLSSENYKICYDIWLLKEYGVERSWTKEYVFDMHVDLDIEACDLFMKLFKDGDINMLCSTQMFDFGLCHFSNKTQTAHQLGLHLERVDYPNEWLLTPSLLSLQRNLGMENVISF